MAKTKTKTITLENHGQDFLEWDVDTDGVVIACRPFQSWIWVGTKIVTKQIKPGVLLSIRTKDCQRLQLNYPVESVVKA